MTGWVSFFAGFSAPIAAAALAFTDYLSHFFPVLRHGQHAVRIRLGNFRIHLGPAQLAACGSDRRFHRANCLGVGRTAKVQNVLTSIKLCVMVGFVVLGLASGNGQLEPFFRTGRAHVQRSRYRRQFVVSLLWVMVGYSGWNAATYVAEEVRRPERTLPAALAVGTAMVAVLYLG